MRESNTNAIKGKSNIQCVEVLILRNAVLYSDNLARTLSVYSLENQPVAKSIGLDNSEVFHFMLYDWKRTIRELLDDNKVSYSVIQFFTPDDIYSDDKKQKPVSQTVLLSAHGRRYTGGIDAESESRLILETDQQKSADLVY